MDYLMIHANQKNYVVIGVLFNPGGKIYHYKAEANANWRIDDLAIVRANGFADNTAITRSEQIKLVQVVQVVTNPLAILSPDRLYKWALGKVDPHAADARETAQAQMVEYLAEWELLQRRNEMLDRAQKMLAGLPDGQVRFESFAALGGGQ